MTSVLESNYVVWCASTCWLCTAISLPDMSTYWIWCNRVNHGSCKYRSVHMRFQMADISTGGHYTHGQRFLTNINRTPVSEERKTCSPPVSNSFSALYGSNSCKTDYDWVNQRVVLVVIVTMQLCHVMEPDKDVDLLAIMVWQLYLQGTQMVLQRLYILSCRYS